MQDVKLIESAPGALAALATFDMPVVSGSQLDQFSVPGSPDWRGACTLDITFTGTGTLKAELYITNGSSYKMVAGSSAICTGLAAGGYFYSFTVPPCKSYYVKLTNTHGSNAINVSSAILAVA